ncbi:DNA primase, partial [Gallibacterium genomosp. 3]
MMKLTNAPFLKEQNSEPYDALTVLAGSEAWQMWNNGDGEGWKLLAEAIGTDYTEKPVILGEKQLNNINMLRIAPKGKKRVDIYQFGELSDNHLDAIVLNLAQDSPDVEIVTHNNNIGDKVKDLSSQLEKIKQNDHVSVMSAKDSASKVTVPTAKPDKDNLLPYIEERTESGKRGLYRIIPKLDKDTGEINERVQWLSDVVDVIGIGRSENESYLVLQWQLEGSHQKVVEALPLGDVGEREGWRTLKNRGLKVTTNTALKNELADYLQNAGNRTLWTITHATGWQNGAYILPNGEVIGHPETPVLFRSQSSSFSGYDTKGTLASWQKEIAQYVRGNPSMMLGVAVALSAPLIHHLNADSFGVHLFGGSTSGKTTTANIANSIYGHPEITRVSWNATSLGLTNEAAARNDGFLVMDEIGQGANKKHIEQTAYALFNGVGKIQGAKEGGNRELSRWRIMAFSTGE